MLQAKWLWSARPRSRGASDVEWSRLARRPAGQETAMIKGAFPGMDPYLEQDWLDFHTRLMTYVCDQLQEQLPEDLLGADQSRGYSWKQEEATSQPRHPDVRVVDVGGQAVERQRFWTYRQLQPLSGICGSSKRAANPLRSVTSRSSIRNRGRVITTIELISPTNKCPGEGQKLYVAKREECLAAGVNVVEIDLTAPATGCRYCPS